MSASYLLRIMKHATSSSTHMHERFFEKIKYVDTYRRHFQDRIGSRMLYYSNPKV